MTDEERSEEGAEEAIEDLEAPAGVWSDVVGGIPCQLPTSGGGCTGQTFCKPGTVQDCHLPTCKFTAVFVE